MSKDLLKDCPKTCKNPGDGHVCTLAPRKPITVEIDMVNLGLLILHDKRFWVYNMFLIMACCECHS